jgi:cytochrome b subunit of formate dehydrogenase
MSVLAQPNRRPAALVLAGVLFAGGLVAVSLGVYAHAHTPGGRPLFQFGFSGMLQLKAWFSTAVLVLLVVQVVTALWMWGRLPGVAAGGSAVAWSHRWSGTAAFVLSLPVAVHCLWALGFGVGKRA